MHLSPDDSTWNRQDITRADWTTLALAFYALANGSRTEYDRLSAPLREGVVGKLCAQYLETGDHHLLDQAGVLLTGSGDWYTYLGRTF